MSPSPIHYGTIHNGTLKLKNEQRYKDHLSSLNGDVRILIEKNRKNRSDRSNRYYWAYLAIVEAETGNDANDIHELAKRKFLTPVFKKIMGQEVKLPRSTTTLDSKSFTDYITKIEQWTGVPAPDPNEFYQA